MAKIRQRSYIVLTLVLILLCLPLFAQTVQAEDQVKVEIDYMYVNNEGNNSFHVDTQYVATGTTWESFFAGYQMHYANGIITDASSENVWGEISVDNTIYAEGNTQYYPYIIQKTNPYEDAVHVTVYGYPSNYKHAYFGFSYTENGVNLDSGTGWDLLMPEALSYGSSEAISFVKRNATVYSYMNELMNKPYATISVEAPYTPSPGVWDGYNMDINVDSSKTPSAGLYIPKADREGFSGGIATESFGSMENTEFRWIYLDDNVWKVAQDWQRANNWLTWKPEKSGDYLVIGQARLNGDDNSIIQASAGYSYHPIIADKCQMPYQGAGGGYLIGMTTYINEGYTCEMLVLDCTLLSQGKNAWIYTTGQCHVPDNAFWTIWQPQYGYYWTLFRVYNESGELVDQMCYGFTNT